jgi:hypothetical protein
LSRHPERVCVPLKSSCQIATGDGFLESRKFFDDVVA